MRNDERNSQGVDPRVEALMHVYGYTIIYPTY